MFLKQQKTYLPKGKLLVLNDDCIYIYFYLSGNIMTGFAIENNENLKKKENISIFILTI